MQVSFDISPAGVTARGLRVRRVEAPQVRRVHVFVDANGESGLVVRNSLWRFVHIPAAALRDPQLLDGARALLDAVRGTATVDPQVDSFLAAPADTARTQFADAA